MPRTRTPYLTIAARRLTTFAVADLVGDTAAPAAAEALAWEARRLARRGRAVALRVAVLALWGCLFVAVCLHWLATAAWLLAQRGTIAGLSLLRRHGPAVCRAANGAAGWAAGQARAGWESFRDGRAEGLARRALVRAVDAGVEVLTWASEQRSRLAAAALVGSVALLAVAAALWDAAR